MHEGFIYVIKCGSRYKIGFTRSILSRLFYFETACPEKIELVFTQLVHNPSKVESELHKEFKKKRKHGEWFELSPEDLEEIEDILDFEDAFLGSVTLGVKNTDYVSFRKSK